MSGSTASPGDHLAAVESWRRESPVPLVAAQRLSLALVSLQGLSAVRRQVRAFLTSCLPPGTVDGEEHVERAVMVIDELTSNALRHGAEPADLHVFDDEGQWLVVVADSAPGVVPVPAVGRPAGAGGYGLHMISDLSRAHGVHYGEHRKLVWAAVPTS